MEVLGSLCPKSLTSISPGMQMCGELQWVSSVVISIELVFQPLRISCLLFEQVDYSNAATSLKQPILCCEFKANYEYIWM